MLRTFTITRTVDHDGERIVLVPVLGSSIPAKLCNGWKAVGLLSTCYWKKADECGAETPPAEATVSRRLHWLAANNPP